MPLLNNTHALLACYAANFLLIRGMRNFVLMPVGISLLLFSLSDGRENFGTDILLVAAFESACIFLASFNGSLMRTVLQKNVVYIKANTHCFRGTHLVFLLPAASSSNSNTSALRLHALRIVFSSVSPIQARLHSRLIG